MSSSVGATNATTKRIESRRRSWLNGRECINILREDDVEGETRWSGKLVSKIHFKWAT